MDTLSVTSPVMVSSLSVFVPYLRENIIMAVLHYNRLFFRQPMLLYSLSNNDGNILTSKVAR